MPLAGAEEAFEGTGKEKGGGGGMRTRADQSAQADPNLDPEEMGVWVQRATFRSAFRLNCPPSFAVHDIECAVSPTSRSVSCSWCRPLTFVFSTSSS